MPRTHIYIFTNVYKLNWCSELETHVRAFIFFELVQTTEQLIVFLTVMISN